MLTCWPRHDKSARCTQQVSNKCCLLHQSRGFPIRCNGVRFRMARLPARHSDDAQASPGSTVCGGGPALKKVSRGCGSKPRQPSLFVASSSGGSLVLFRSRYLRAEMASTDALSSRPGCGAAKQGGMQPSVEVPWQHQGPGTLLSAAAWAAQSRLRAHARSVGRLLSDGRWSRGRLVVTQLSADDAGAEGSMRHCADARPGELSTSTGSFSDARMWRDEGGLAMSIANQCSMHLVRPRVTTIACGLCPVRRCKAPFAWSPGPGRRRQRCSCTAKAWCCAPQSGRVYVTARIAVCPFSRCDKPHGFP